MEGWQATDRQLTTLPNIFRQELDGGAMAHILQTHVVIVHGLIQAWKGQYGDSVLLWSDKYEWVSRQ